MSTIITLPWNPFLQETHDWAKLNCSSYITYDVHRYITHDGYRLGDVDRIDYFFSDGKDALMFALRWS